MANSDTCHSRAHHKYPVQAQNWGGWADGASGEKTSKTLEKENHRAEVEEKENE